MLTVVGSIGMGLMWGWLLVLAIRVPGKRPFLQALALIIATAATSSIQLLFGGWPAFVRFLAAALIALFVHLLWLRSMRPE